MEKEKKSELYCLSNILLSKFQQNKINKQQTNKRAKRQKCFVSIKQNIHRHIRRRRRRRRLPDDARNHYQHVRWILIIQTI